jgi:cytochrome c peroxidase
LGLCGPLGCSCNEAPFPSDAELELLRELQFSPTPPPDSTNRHADDAAAAALGDMLFGDASFSSCGTISCASCHPPPLYALTVATRPGCRGTPGRNAPSLTTVAFRRWLYWDGRKDTLWSHPILPLTRATEMDGDVQNAVTTLQSRYGAEYLAVFGSMPASDPDPQRVLSNFGKAIAAYLRTLPQAVATFDSRLSELISAAEQDIAAGGGENHVRALPDYLGFKVFVRKGRCIACHKGPQLSDQLFHNLGIKEPDAPDRGRAEGIEELMKDPFNGGGVYSDDPDTGRIKLDRIPTDLPDEGAEGAFKTGSLRNVALTPPYMHNGTLMTLDDVIDFYDRGGDPSGFLGMRAATIIPLKLSADEKAALKTLLQTLDAQ